MVIFTFYYTLWFLYIKALLESNPDDKEAQNDLNLVEKLQKQTDEADAALEAKDYAKVYITFLASHPPSLFSITLFLPPLRSLSHSTTSTSTELMSFVRHSPSTFK